MVKKPTQRLVTAALMLALGVLLPLVSAHGFGIPGTVLLPMHIPVLLCAFLAGPLWGAVVGLVLPILNTLLTGMPVIFPMAPIMTAELFTYGLVGGTVYKLFGYSKKYIAILLSLLCAMIAGRLSYGLMVWILLLFGASLGKITLIGAIVTGLPGIAIQLVLIPIIVYAVSNGAGYRLFLGKRGAIARITRREAKCIIISNKRGISQSNRSGVSYLLECLDNGMLEGAFVADTIIGRAAAMILTRGGVCACYGENMSRGALEWLTAQSVRVSYKNLTDMIINRRGDGICPMEEAVSEVTDEERGVELLRERLIQLKSSADSSLFSEEKEALTKK